MISCGWIWIYAGLALMLLELLSPGGFVIVFFGLSAITVGALRLLTGSALNTTWQIALFSAFSIAYIVILRKWLKSIFVGDKSADAPSRDDFVGRIGRMTQPVTPEIPGRVLSGDSEWNANAGESIPTGAAVKVVSQNNLTLTVEAV